MEPWQNGHDTTMRLWLASLSVLAVACGSVVPPASDDIASFDASVDTTITPPGDGATFDSTVDATDDAPPFGGGGPFLCDTCVCDGTLDLCFHASGGPQNAPLSDAGAGDSGAGDAGAFGDASACDLDAGPSPCEAIPIDCLPNPTCACLLTHWPPCSCTVDPSGHGLRVDCEFP